MTFSAKLPPRPNSRRKRVWVTTWLVRLVLMILARMQVFVRARVSGRRRIPRRGPVIVALNHHSMLDPVLVFGMLRRRVAMWAGEFLFKGLLGWLLRWMGTIRVDRGSAQAGRAIDEGVVVLRHGGVVAGFIAGKITPEGKPYEAKTGLARMAFKANAPVAPVGLSGTSRMLKTRRIKLFRRIWLLRRIRMVRIFQRVELNVGELIYPSRQTDDPTVEEVLLLTAAIHRSICEQAGTVVSEEA